MGTKVESMRSNRTGRPAALFEPRWLWDAPQGPRQGVPVLCGPREEAIGLLLGIGGGLHECVQLPPQMSVLSQVEVLYQR